MTERVLLTGIDGFIGGHIAVRLLEAGYTVRGTVRALKGDGSLTDSLASVTGDPSVSDRLEVIQADLMDVARWPSAVAGFDAVIHTASPVPIKQPRNGDEVIKPAVDGTLRLLEAARAAGVRRFVLTSSTVAITEGHAKARTMPYTEADWTNVRARRLSAYTLSKTFAEQSAWAFVHRHGGPELCAINPGLTIGPLIYRHRSTSMQVVERILRNADPAHPRFGYPIADVRDIADMHVRALKVADAAGQRFIGASGFMWYPEIVAFLAEAFPQLSIGTRVLPDWLVLAIAPFKRRLATVAGILGAEMPVSTRHAETVLGVSFRDKEDALLAAAQAILGTEAPGVKP